MLLLTSRINKINCTSLQHIWRLTVSCFESCWGKLYNKSHIIMHPLSLSWTLCLHPFWLSWLGLWFRNSFSDLGNNQLWGKQKKKKKKKLEQWLESSFDLELGGLMSFSVVVCAWLYRCNCYETQNLFGMSGMINKKK